MVHVHGRVVSERAAVGVPAPERIAVPVDVGKHTAMAMAMVADFAGDRVVAPFTFSLDRSGIGELIRTVERVVVARGARRVEVSVEAAGHCHRPLAASRLLPAEWELIELNPAHVTEQRRVLGKRGVRTDQVDLVAMFDLLVAARGHPAGRRDGALAELQAWTAMRFRRLGAVIAAKNQLLGQMDRAFPGAGLLSSLTLGVCAFHLPIQPPSSPSSTRCRMTQLRLRPEHNPTHRFDYLFPSSRYFNPPPHYSTHHLTFGPAQEDALVMATATMLHPHSELP